MKSLERRDIEKKELWSLLCPNTFCSIRNKCLNQTLIWGSCKLKMEFISTFELKANKKGL